MKKPTIATIKIDEIITVSVVTPELRYLWPHEITDAYEEMIEALIQSTDELKHLYNILEIDADKTFTVKQNKKALKKAGCTE